MNYYITNNSDKHINDKGKVDLTIVLGTLASSQESSFDEDFEIFHEAQKYNSLLEIVCFIEEKFDQDGTTLIKKIKKEGIRLI